MVSNLSESKHPRSGTSPAILDALQASSINHRLSSNGIKAVKKIHIFPSIASSNDYLLENESACDQVTVCLAEQQTQGRGRYGHGWTSPSGVNLYMSLSWPTLQNGKHYDVLSLWFLLAITTVLERYGVKEVKLKWPNDICVDNKKLAGVLLERKLGQKKSNLVIGVGLNIAMSMHDDIQLQTPWIDLLMIDPDWNISRNVIAADLLTIFIQTLDDFEQDKLVDLSNKWESYDMLKDQHIKFKNNDEVCTGLVLGVDDNGNLVISLDDEIKVMHSSQVKEIKLI